MKNLSKKNKERIGVFVCHCGRNIAATVDTSRVVEGVLDDPLVVHAEDYDYMCSDVGQDLVESAIDEKDLTGVVVAACSPSLHESTFRLAVERAGLNPYKCEIANIREQCSWVHTDKERATNKALRLTLSAVKKVAGNKELEPIKADLHKKALVIGGGIAGINAALDIASAGYSVVLVERKSTIGGHLAELAETFPTLDCAQCVLAPLMSEISHHPNIEILTLAEVTKVDGHVGNFRVSIRKNPRYVDTDKCTMCNNCVDVCPIDVPSEFNEGLSLRKAIYIPFGQAVPSSYVIDPESCIVFSDTEQNESQSFGVAPITCGKCAEPDICQPEAINFDGQAEIIEDDFGIIVVATGYELYDPRNLGEYGAYEYPDIVTSLQFERLLAPDGPTSGIPKRPSDGSIPNRIAFIHCAGSRDERHQPYCSHICCTYLAKHALLYKEVVPDGEVYSLYIDIRAVGKNYEDFIRRSGEDAGINYIRGKASRIYEQNGKVKVLAVDSLLGERIELDVDMAVLGLAMIPSRGIEELASELRISLDEYGFLQEAHPKIHPVESATSGVFLAGCAQTPMDVQTTVAQARGAASGALGVLSQEKISHAPTIIEINKDLCSGCRLCVSACPYEAIKMVNEKAEVVELLCEGCGTCASTCPSNAITLKNDTDEQIDRMLEAIVGAN